MAQRQLRSCSIYGVQEQKLESVNEVEVRIFLIFVRSSCYILLIYKKNICANLFYIFLVDLEIKLSRKVIESNKF